MKKLSIIIPFLNEEKTIEGTLDKVVSVDLLSLNFTKEIILVNDGSNDNSEKIILDYIVNNWEKAEFQYIEYGRNYWKWYACKEWFKKATWDYFIIQDADNEYTPSDYKNLLEKLESRQLDFLYWSRILGLDEFKNTYSTKTFLFWWLVVSILTSILTFTKVTDEPTCYKLYKKELRDLLVLPKENWFEWEPAITVLLLKKWFKYWEEPINYTARNFKEWKKINWKDWIKAILTLFKRRFFK